MLKMWPGVAVQEAPGRRPEKVKCMAEVQVLTGSGMTDLYCDLSEDHKGPHHCEMEWG